MQPNTRRRLKNGAALATLVAMAVVTYSLVGASTLPQKSNEQSVTQVQFTKVASSLSDAPKSIPEPTWVNMTSDSWQRNTSGLPETTTTAENDLQTTVAGRLQKRTTGLFAAFGPATDGQVLTFIRGKISWENLPILHGAANSFDTGDDTGGGRKPYQLSDGERHYGGGGGSSSTTVTTNTTTVTGLSQSTADDLYVNISGDTMDGALSITYNGLGLSVSGTASGDVLHAERLLTVTGSAIFDGNARFNSTMTLNGVTYSFPGSDGNGSGKVLKTNAAGQLSWSDDNTVGTGLSQNSGDERYVNQAGDTMTGALTINVTNGLSATLGLKVLNAFSGAVVHAEKTLTSSGNLVWERAASGASLYVATSINGAGLTDCDAATQTLAWDATTGRFSCGTDADTDTTYTAGQGFTTNGTNFRLSDSFSGTSLKIFGTLTGNILHAEKTLTSSGTLTWEGAASGASLYVATSLNGAGLADCDLSTQKLLWDSATGRFSCGTDLNTGTTAAPSINSGSVFTLGDARYVKKQGDTMTGVLTINKTGAEVGLDVKQAGWFNSIHSTGSILSKGTLSGVNLIISGVSSFSGASIFKNNLIVKGTLSGQTLQIAQNASISGALLVKTGITSKGTVSGATINGFHLGSCNGVSQKLLYNNSTQTFECGTDLNSGGTGTFGTGNVITIGDGRYVNTSGDTMTGVLTINITNGLSATLGLKVLNAFSGAVIHAEKTLTSSGTLTVESTISGASLYVATSLNGAGLTDCDAATQTLNWDSTTGRFSCGTDSDTTYTAGQGLTTNGTNFRLSDSFSGTSLKIFGTLTGNILHAEKTLTSSGTLTIEGAMSGASLYVATSINGAGLADCDLSTQKLLWDSSTGRFSCGTDLNTGTTAAPSINSGSVFTLGDARYVKKQGDTMTGVLTINITNGLSATLGLKVLNAFSGAVIHAEKTLTSSGGLVWEGAASGSSLYLGTSIRGAGLSDCTGGNKLLWDSTTGRFSCGTDQSAGTGLDQNSADARYVNQSGDTMTGLLTINLAASAVGLDVKQAGWFNSIHSTGSILSKGTLSGVNLIISGVSSFSGSSTFKNNLTVKGTLSGQTLQIAQNASISGALLIKGNIATKSNLSGASLFGFGLGDCSNSTTSKLIYNNSTGKFSCATDVDTDTNTTYTAGQGFTTNGTNFSLSSALSGTSLRLFGTLTGNILHAEKTFTSSGTLTIEGAMSGASLYVATSLNGAGLTDCDLSTQKLAWDSTTGRFSCGTDLNTGTSAPPSINSGSVFTLGDARFVKKQGDTMTGVLTINKTGAEVGLDVKQAGWFNSIHSTGSILSKGTISGSNLIVSGVSSFSGIVVLKGNLLSKGTLSGQNLIISGVSSHSGAAMFKSNVTIKGTLSGQTLQIANNASISGALLIKGNITTKANLSGSALFGFGLGDCSNSTTSKLIYNNSTGKFSCATDTDTDTNTTYTAGQGLTTNGTNFRLSDSFSGTSLKIFGTLTGNILHAEKTLTSSGGLVWEGAASGSSLYLGTSLRGAGLSDCTGGNKLLWDSTTGRFSCGVDQSAGTGLDQNSADSRYVNQSGDTMTGLLTINLAASAVGLDVKQAGWFNSIHSTGSILSKGTLSGVNLIISGVSSFSGASTFKNNLIVRGTLSGQTLQIAQNASISGALLIKGNIATKATLSGASLIGFGLGDCSNSTTSKLIYNNSTGKFSCATDVDTDTNTTYTAGQGLTTNGTNFRLSDSFSGTSLKVFGTLTGSVLHAEKTLTSSGTLTWEGAASGASLYVATSLNGAGLTDCDAATQTLAWDATTGRFSCGTDSDTTYTAGQGLTTNGTNFRLSDSFSGTSLKIFGTLTGSVLHAEKTLTSSGTLTIEGAMSGASLYVATSINGAGLADCDLSTQKLLWDSSTGRFSCGTDQTGSSGLSFTNAEGIYVNQGGDTMTGALNINVTGGGFATVGLKVVNTITGAIIHAEKNLTSSGNIVAAQDITAKRNLSGSSITVSRNGSISGSLTVKTSITSQGSLSGSTFYGANLGDCNNSTTSKLIYNLATGKFGCATDQTGSVAPSINSGSVFTLGNLHFVNVGGDTMTGALVINKTGASVGLDVKQAAWVNTLHATGSILSKGTISGSNLIVSGVSSFSGIVVLKGNLLSKGTLSGQNLIVSGVSSFSGASTFKNNLTVRGTLSGQTLQIANNASISGAVIIKGNLATKATLSGASVYGFGLGDCSNSTTSKLIYNNSTGKFSCATDVDTDTNTTYTAGQGFTTNGTNFRLSDSFSGTSLKVFGTLTGSVLHAEKTLTSSGTLTVEGTISGASLYVATSINGAGLTDCDAAAQTLAWDATTGRFSCGTDSDTTYTAGQGLTTNGTNFSLSSALSGTSLKIFGTLTGNILHAEKTLTSSGTLTVEGTISGASLYVATSFSGVGLSDCDTAATSKLLWDITTGRFSCGTDQNSGGGSAPPSINSGSVFTLGNLHFVNIGGDTMTGALTINKTGAEVALDIKQAAWVNSLHSTGSILSKGNLSGETLIVSNNANISGALLVKNNISTRATLSGKTLTIMSGNSYFLGNLGIGKSGTPNTQLEIVGMGSGTSLFAMRALTSSGFLAVQQSIAIGSGAIVMEQKANNTGAYLMSSFTGSVHPLLALDSARRSFKAPAIMFGYRGSFDTSLQRTDTGTLALSGSLVIQNTLSIKVFGAATATTVCRTATGMLAACSSSLRYKEDITDLSMGLSTLRQMHAVNFKWKGRDERDIGFIAEEVAAVDPMLATYNAAGQIEGVKYMQLTAVLTNAIQTLDTRLLGITNDSGTVLHARDIITSSGALKIATLGTFGSGILLDTKYTNGSTDVFTIKSNVGGTGKTVLRINASGSVFTTGTFNSQGADYAEWFKSANKLKTGEVVCIDTYHDNAVLRCVREADPDVMGIVSTRPAFIGNTIPGTEGLSVEAMARKGYFLIGLIGQVPAKATLEGGAIRSGDAVTSASNDGFIRKAKAGDSTVGVALEAYDGDGVRTINVLISRRNSSMTVDAVSQKVLDTIASMQIGDEVRRMVAASAEQFSLSGSVALTVAEQLESFNLEGKINAAIEKHLSGATLPLTITSNTMTGFSLAGGTLHAAALSLSSGATISGALRLNGSMMVGNQFSLLRQGFGGQALLTVSGSSIEIGSLMATGSLKVLGNITITGLSTFLGDIDVRGELTLSDRQAGFAVIPATGTSVTVVFSMPLTGVPVMNVTPQGRVGSEWWIESSTGTGFILSIASPASKDIRFSWTAISTVSPRTTIGTGSLAQAQLIAFPVNTLGQPVSSDPIWNGCIQGHPVVDADGIPFSCARYRSDSVWDHPDLHISFIYISSHDPAILTIPDGYEIVVVQGEPSVASPNAHEENRALEELPAPEAVSSTGNIVPIDNPPITLEPFGPALQEESILPDDQASSVEDSTVREE